MKPTSLILLAFSAMLFISSCSKNDNLPTDSKNRIEISADTNGDFTITGHISAPAPLQRVELFKNEETAAFLIDETDAKYKTEYDFSYRITDISQSTKVRLVAIDENGGTTERTYLLNKN